MNLETKSLRVEQEIDGKMKWGSIEDQLVEKGGRKEYITERNGRNSWERQGIITFSIHQWSEWMNEPFLYSHMLVPYATDHDVDILVSVAALGSTSAMMSVMTVWGSQKCVSKPANLLVGDYADRCWDFRNYRLLQQWEILSVITVVVHICLFC